MALNIKIASPCPADWAQMAGDDRVRHCAQCELNVYNLAALTHAEIEQLVVAREGRLCVRLYKRSDGTMITRDCPVGFRMKVRRVSRIAGAALSAAMTALPVAAQPQKTSGSGLVQIATERAAIEFEVTDPSRAAISDVLVRVTDRKTNVQAQARTDARGVAKMTNLTAGEYTVSLEKDNFKTVTRSLTVSSREQANVDIRMELDLMVTQGVLVVAQDGSELRAVETVEPLVRTELISPRATDNPKQPSQSWIKKLLHKLR